MTKWRTAWSFIESKTKSKLVRWAVGIVLVAAGIVASTWVERAATDIYEETKSYYTRGKVEITVSQLLVAEYNDTDLPQCDIELVITNTDEAPRTVVFLSVSVCGGAGSYLFPQSSEFRKIEPGSLLPMTLSFSSPTLKKVLRRHQSTDITPVILNYVVVGEADTMTLAVPSSAVKKCTYSQTPSYESDGVATSDGLMPYVLDIYSHVQDSVEKTDNKSSLRFYLPPSALSDIDYQEMISEWEKGEFGLGVSESMFRRQYGGLHVGQPREQVERFANLPLDYYGVFGTPEGVGLCEEFGMVPLPDFKSITQFIHYSFHPGLKSEKFARIGDRSNVDLLVVYERQEALEPVKATLDSLGYSFSYLEKNWEYYITRLFREIVPKKRYPKLNEALPALVEGLNKAAGENLPFILWLQQEDDPDRELVYRDMLSYYGENGFVWLDLDLTPYRSPVTRRLFAKPVLLLVGSSEETRAISIDSMVFGE